MPKRVEAVPFFRPALEEQRYLPECPRVIGESLLWISSSTPKTVPQGGINVLDLPPAKMFTTRSPAAPDSSPKPSDPGVLLVGMERRLVLYDLNRRAITETLAHIPEDPRVIINDGIAVPGGAIFGTKHLEFSEPVAALYHYDNATRQVRELLGGQVCSNGKYLHDGILVDIDTKPKTITEYRYDGELHPLRLIAPPDSLPALPDGLRPMPGGQSVVVAFYNPAHAADGIAQEIRLSDGEVLTEFIFPGSPRVTCPAVWEPGRRHVPVFHHRHRGHAGRDARHRPRSRHHLHGRAANARGTIMNLNRRDFIVAPAALLATDLYPPPTPPFRGSAKSGASARPI